VNREAMQSIRPFMRTLAVVASVLFFATSASASPTTAHYRVRGPCHVRTTEGPTYDKSIDTELDVAVSGPDDAVRLELTGKGHSKCTLMGKRSGNTVTLTPNQKCPQKVDDGMAHGELMGVLQHGRAVSNGAHVTVVSHWTLEGDVKVLFRTLHVKGTLDTNIAGKRVD
jgi:hypothetical protein